MKTNRTTIPVNIATEYTFESGNELEKTRQQIELSSLYLQSLFNSVKHLASALENQISENEFCYDLRNLADIGYALSGSIFAAVSVFEDIENDIRESNFESEAAGESRVSELDVLAVQMSEILNSPHLPKGIYNGLQRAINDIYNDSDSDFITNLESSPEYLRSIFAGYVKKHADE